VLEFLKSWKEAAPAAGAIIAFVSAFVALGVFDYTRRANRRRATLDMVMKTLLDDSAQKRYSQFKRLIYQDDDLDDCFKLESLAILTQDNAIDRDIVIQQLNAYELVSLGIRRGLFDEGFYKRWFHNQFTKDYESSLDFIRKAQELKNKTSIYCEYSALYQKWSKDGHPDSSPNRVKMAYWELTRNYQKIDRARESSKPR
jgi:Domain of unknown function (DUF4760)